MIDAERTRAARQRTQTILQGTDPARDGSEDYAAAVRELRAAVAAIPKAATEAERITALEHALEAFDKRRRGT